MRTSILKTIKRALIGLVVGLIVGSIVVALDQIRYEATANVRVINLPILALLLGGAIGLPSGIITSVLSGMTDYRSGWGIEWAIVGTLAGILIVGLGRPYFGQPGLLIIVLALTGILAERSTAILLKDRGQDKRVPLRTLAVYVVGVLLITMTLRAVFGWVASVID